MQEFEIINEAQPSRKSERGDRSELTEALEELLDRESSTTLETMSEPAHYSWCGAPNQESPCLVGMHPECEAITQRLQLGDEPSILAEEYRVPEYSLYEHLTKGHFRPDPRKQQAAEVSRQLETELIERLAESDGDNEDEVLFIMNKWLLHKMIEKIEDVSPNEIIKFLKEFRQNALDRKKLRENASDSPTVRVDSLTINQSDKTLASLTHRIQDFCEHCRPIVDDVLSLREGKMEHVIDPDALMRLPMGASMQYITDVQKTYEAKHGDYMEEA